MRQAGTLQREQDAQRFVDYLLTLDVEARADEGSDGWSIWIVDEAHLQRGKDELADYRRNSDDPKYDQAAQAKKIRGRAARRDKKIATRTVHMNRRWERPTGRMPVTILLILASCAVTFGSNFGRKIEPVITATAIAAVTDEGDGFYRWRPGLVDITEDYQLWRLVTPIFIHFTIMGIPFIHLLFNMMWLYQLGGQIEVYRGSLRMLLLVLVIAVLSNVCQYMFNFSIRGLDVRPNPLGGGMSGVVYGLLGYSWMKSRYDSGSGIYIRPNTVTFMMIWFVLCVLNMAGNVGNTAHGVGLLVGIVIGYVPHLVSRLSR
ncbi:MAG: rhomboid family intramembrane serine protease [Planctomycetes bacterium]|nr:rhomboid family intramembrane serine protease [Planctomycetota bacterium]